MSRKRDARRPRPTKAQELNRVARSPQVPVKAEDRNFVEARREFYRLTKEDISFWYGQAKMLARGGVNDAGELEAPPHATFTESAKIMEVRARVVLGVLAKIAPDRREVEKPKEAPPPSRVPTIRIGNVGSRGTPDGAKSNADLRIDAGEEIEITVSQ